MAVTISNRRDHHGLALVHAVLAFAARCLTIGARSTGMPHAEARFV